MSIRNNQDDLEMVLQSYLEEAAEPNPQTLQQWVRRYPQYERELTEFTITWDLMSMLPAHEVNPASTQMLVERGMSAVQEVLRQVAPSQPPAIRSLLKQASALGLSTAEFARRLRMSIPLVTKLERRQIARSSIPAQAIALLAEVLQQTTASVSEYLDHSPVLAARASYKSKRAPVATQQSFFDAVHDDPELDSADRDYWAALNGK